MNTGNGDIVLRQPGHLDPDDKSMGNIHIENLKLGSGSGSQRDESSGLKTAPNSTTILLPQPSDNPNDPLNWSWRKKHMVLLAVSFGALLTDWVRPHFEVESSVRANPT